MSEKLPVEQKNENLSVVAQVKGIISQESVKKKFEEVLGKKAPQFLASITNVIAGSTQLKKCPPNTIMGAAFVAATYDLPIDSNLGFAAIVPYNNNKYNLQTKQWEKHPEAQFQMMYKGFIQLAIRSGYYEKMNCSVVYKDELVSYNPITGEVDFVTDFSQCTQRMNGKSEDIAGYYAWFKLLTGFRKELFMTRAEVENHARKYSTAYRNARRAVNGLLILMPWLLKQLSSCCLVNGAYYQLICRELLQMTRRHLMKVGMRTMEIISLML